MTEKRILVKNSKRVGIGLIAIIFVQMIMIIIGNFDFIPVSNGETFGDFEYTIDSENNTVEIKKYKGSETEVTIPDTIDGKKVKDIGGCAFMYNKNLRKITIQEGVTKIGFSAFEYCTNLISVIIPQTVIEIENDAFGHCSNLVNITLPDKIKEINTGIFEGCTNLKSINVPEEVINIGYNSFMGCINLKNINVANNNKYYKDENGVLFNKKGTKLIRYPGGKNDLTEYTIPSTVTDIYGGAFFDCNSLNIINIPQDVKDIGFCFTGSNNLTEINVVNSNQFYKSVDGVLFNKDGTELIKYPEGKKDITKFYIPEGVTKISQYAFENVSGLKNITIPRGITIIDSDTFRNCSGLVSINIPEGVTSIGPDAFERCSSLKSIILPEGIESIGGSAFLDCSNLIDIVIPKSVTSISSYFNDSFAGVKGPIYYHYDNKAMKDYIYYHQSSSDLFIVLKLEKINITTSPTKTSYIEGQNFDKTGMVVDATYNNGKSKEVTDYTVTNGKNLQMGRTAVTISYTEDGITKVESQSITVEKKKLEKIQVTTSPSKTNYIEGQSFEKAGIVVKVTYNDGSIKIINDDEANLTVKNGENLQMGRTAVTISYTEDGIEKIASQNITVEKKKLEKIQVTKVPIKTNYIEGQNFDKTGMVVAITYNNKTTKTISENDTNLTVIDGNNLAVGTEKVTIRYTENGITKETTQQVTVTAKAMLKIEITKEPTKTSYIEGQDFDKTGIVVTITYNNDTIKTINADDANLKVIDGNNLAFGKENVTIVYKENGVTKEKKQTITVEHKEFEINLPETYRTLKKGENTYISNISPNTTIAETINNLNTNGNITIYKNNEKITDNKLKIATGMKLKAEYDNKIYEYTIAINGDTNGDGESDIKDLLAINKHRLGKALLKNEYETAGDVNKDGKVDIKDLLQINKFRLGKIKNL